MGNPVIIKGNKYGFVLVLDEQLDFILLRKEIAAKFRESNRFFNASSQVAISFEGRKLSNEEKGLVLETIEETTNLNISCIIEDEMQWKNYLCTQVQNTRQELPKKNIIYPALRKTASFYRGNLRAGQTLEVQGGITLIGNIKRGAAVISRGNVIVLGEIEGRVSAGYPNQSQCFILALNMNPTQLQIGKISLYEKKKKRKVQIDDSQIKPKFAFVEKDSIYMEELEKNYRYKVR